MRPITKANNPTVYAEPALTYTVNMRTYPSQTIQQMYAFFGTHIWYQLENANVQTDQEKDDIKKKKFYIEKLKEYYPDARRDLIESIGEVCSFCGMPIRDNAQVEHISPKSWFPDQILLWNNFLLACRDCNTRKTSRPTGQPNDTLADFVWPHTTLQGRMVSHQLVTYRQISELENYRYKPIPDKRLKVVDLVPLLVKGHIEIAIAREKTRDVTLTFTATGNKHFIAALVLPKGNTAKETVNGLLKLNTYTYSSDVSDRRLIERTQAWIQAVDAVRNLVSVQNAPDQVRLAVAQQAADTIAATGFWPAWVEVFMVEGVGFLGQEYLDFFEIVFKSNRFPGTEATRLFF